MEWVAFLVTAVSSYLLGSIPTGYLVGRAQGLDIRQSGSGNIGAANALRTLGKGAGALVLGVDAVKGFAACQWVAPFAYARWLQPTSPDPAGREHLVVVAGFAAILGHIFTCWLRFRGGKGIATAAGVFGALAWPALLLSFGLWVVVVALTRYVSLASLTAAASLPITVWLADGHRWSLVLAWVVSAVAIYRHKANIQRLLAGREPRFGQFQPPQPLP